MGREIRMVPANWEHPKRTTFDFRLHREVENYRPMRDECFRVAMREWIAEWDKWERGERPEYCSDEYKDTAFWEYHGGPPDPEYYRPEWKPEDQTWFQLYETVSEGCPVTPPFATKQELADYLVANGDFWDQKRREEGCSIMPRAPWPREQAESFVFGEGFAPSIVIANGKVMSGVEFVTQPTTPQGDNNGMD